jgi:hypothetical protein
VRINNYLPYPAENDQENNNSETTRTQAIDRIFIDSGCSEAKKALRLRKYFFSQLVARNSIVKMMFEF